jgi:AcrR family transcriptional regulator
VKSEDALLKEREVHSVLARPGASWLNLACRARSRAFIHQCDGRGQLREAVSISPLLAAALRIFSERSIDQSTVDEIASAADVGKGTIYNHFQSKEEIVVAFLVGIEQQVQKRVKHYASAPKSLQAILASFLQFQLKLKSPHHQFVRVFFAQMFAHGSASSIWMRQLQDAINPPLEYLFSVLEGRGLIRQDLDRQDLIQLFKILHVGLMTVWVMEGPPWRATHRLLKEQMRVFCEGIEVRHK